MVKDDTSPRPVDAYLGVIDRRNQRKRLVSGPYFGETPKAACELADSKVFETRKWCEINVKDWHLYFDFNDWGLITIVFPHGQDPGHQPLAGVL
mgnify:FL=1